MTTQVISDLRQIIQDTLREDSKAKEIIVQFNEGKTTKFRFDDGFLFYNGCLYVLGKSHLWRDLLKECHDLSWAGYPRQHRMTALVEKSFYWDRLWKDVEEYVHTCLIC